MAQKIKRYSSIGTMMYCLFLYHHPPQFYYSMISCIKLYHSSKPENSVLNLFLFVSVKPRLTYATCHWKTTDSRMQHWATVFRKPTTGKSVIWWHSS